MKKVIAIVLALVIVGAFAACGGNNNTTEPATPKTATYTVTITKLDCTEMWSKLGKTVNFYASVVSDDYVNVVEITPEQYAKLNVGDIVTVNTEDDGTRYGLVQVEEFNTENKFFYGIG